MYLHHACQVETNLKACKCQGALEWHLEVRFHPPHIGEVCRDTSQVLPQCAEVQPAQARRPPAQGVRSRQPAQPAQARRQPAQEVPDPSTPRRLDPSKPLPPCAVPPRSAWPFPGAGCRCPLSAGPLDALTPLLPWVICAGTRRPQPLDVVGDLAADGDVRLRLPLVPAILAIVPVVLLVLEEPGTQDLRPAVVDDDEGVLDAVPVPAPVVHSPPACLALSSCV